MRYLIGFLLFIAALILLLVFVFRGGSKTSTPATSSTINLTSYAQTDSVLKVTIEGPQIATENHRAIRITVGRDIREVEVLKGYNEEVLRSNVYSNDQAAFDEFIRGVNLAGFIKANKASAQTDERGFCATGMRYIYELDNGSQHITRLWSDSCGDKQATFAGTGPLIRQLFEAQIPDYLKLTGDVSLSSL